MTDISGYAPSGTDPAVPPKLSFWRKAIMALTLNGHFLPAFCLEDYAWVGKHGQYRELAVIYLKKTLCYETDAAGYGIVRTRSLKILLRETILLVPVVMRFIRHRGAVGRKYREIRGEMTGLA
jgi:hypothetical protein